MTDVVVIGAGPAGMLAALRAGDLGSKTALVTSGDFGGMAANDGPVPVRALAHAARLIRDARQLGRYGIGVSEPSLDYSRLLARATCADVESASDRLAFSHAVSNLRDLQAASRVRFVHTCSRPARSTNSPERSQLTELMQVG